MASRSAVVKNADMSEEMQQDAIDCANQALEKFNIEHIALHRQMCQKSLDLWRAHDIGVTFVVKQNKTLDPMNILGFGTDAIVANTNFLPQPVQQFGRRGIVRRGGFDCHART